MIYTVTLNPSLDYVVRVHELTPGNLHRTAEEELYVGGKGINVANVLSGLGADCLSLGFIAGFTGREIEQRLSRMGLATDFITVAEGMSRINVKLKTGQAMETEINGQGPVIGSQDMELLYQKLEKLKDGDILVLSGSAPRRGMNSRYSGANCHQTDKDELHTEPCGQPGNKGKIQAELRSMETDSDDTYADLCGRLAGRRLKLVIDAEGSLLRNTLKFRPFLIKPNHHELGRLFGKHLIEEESIIACARQLQEEGARNVLVSLAEKGAILLDSNGRINLQRAPQGKVLNSVGAGDALVAGFLYGLTHAGRESLKEDYSEEDYLRALKYGVAAGSAAAFAEEAPERARIEELYRSL